MQKGTVLYKWQLIKYCLLSNIYPNNIDIYKSAKLHREMKPRWFYPSYFNIYLYSVGSLL